MLIWKTRIGALKPLAVFGAILTGLLALVAISDMILAFQNPEGQARPVDLEAVAQGSVNSGQYITISGKVLTNPALTSAKDTGGSFFLSDPSTSSLVLIKSLSLINPPEGEMLTLSGVLHRTAPAQENQVATAAPHLKAAGFETTPKVYLNEGESIPALKPTLVKAGGLLLIFLLCLGAMSLPTGVFVPQPLDKVEIPAAANQEGPINPVKASGKFQKLSRITLPYEFDKDQLSLDKVSATFERAGDWFVIRHRQYKRYRFFGFVTTKIQINDWAVAIDHSSSAQIEPGRIHGWNSKPALRIIYKDRQGNPQTLLLSFKNSESWTRCMLILEDMRLV